MRGARSAALRFATRYGILAAFVLELAVFALLTPRFSTWQNVENVLRQNASIAIIAAGMTFVILTAGIDLSVGSVVALAGVFCADVVVRDWAPPGARVAAGCLVGLAAGAAAGAVNGWVTTRARIPPFVATLAMLTIARGVALHYTESRTISGLPLEFATLGEGWIPALAAALVFVLSWAVLTRTPFGRRVYAVGSNPEAARLCGIRVEGVLLRVYLLSGTLAGLGGVLVAARLNSGYPNAGQLYELDAIAAVVVGGTSLMGGRGSVWGTLVGAYLIGFLLNGLNLLHVEYYSQKIVVGGVLIAAAFLDRFRTEDRP